MKPSTVIASLLALASLAALTWGMLELLQIGTCASGGPYVSARECPDGTGVRVAALAGGATVYIISIIAMSFRSFSGGMFFFGLLFVVLGAAFLYDAATGDGAGGAGWFVGGLFVAMGAAPLVFGLRSLLERDDKPEQPSAMLGWAAQVQASASAASRAVPPPSDRG